MDLIFSPGFPSGTTCAVDIGAAGVRGLADVEPFASPCAGDGMSMECDDERPPLNGKGVTRTPPH
jgi:hypothetical protein